MNGIIYFVSHPPQPFLSLQGGRIRMIFLSHTHPPLRATSLDNIQFRLNLLFRVVSLAHNKKSHCVSSEKATSVAFSFGRQSLDL